MKDYKGKVITVTSSKGGVGKTIFITNLAGVYSFLKRKVLLIDMDLSCGGISVLLNVDKTKTIYNLNDDIINNRFKELDDYVYHYNEFVDIIPACRDPRQGNKIDNKVLEQIISLYKYNYEALLIDTTHVPVGATLTALELADKIIYMITDNPLDLKNSASMLTILKDFSKEKVNVLLNESQNNEKTYFSKFDIKSVIKHNIDYILPSSMYIPNITKYIMEGKILVLNNKLAFKNKSDKELLIKIANDMVGDNNGK